MTLALLKANVVAITHTENDEVVRLIAVRKASKDEEKVYFNQIKD